MQRQTPSSRLYPSCMVRGNNISSELSSSSDLARLQNVSGMVSNQKHLPRSSQVNLPRSVSVKKYYTNGSQEVTVESSVSVSLTFKQDAARTKEVGGHLEEMHASRHQLVCCTCIVYKPRMLVGECGCLSCIDCLEGMKQRYCNICQVGARYIPLEKLIMVSNDGIFVDTNENVKVCMKELIEKVVKEERDFKIKSKILDKQKAAFEKRNYLEKKEIEEILDEEKTLQEKILAKYEAISKLEEAVRLKQDLTYSVPQDQQHQIERPSARYPSALQAEEYNKNWQERLEFNGDNLNIFSGKPSVDVIVSKGFDVKGQGYRNKNISSIDQNCKSIGQKLAAYTENHRFGGADIRNQINFTPCKDEAKPAPFVPKSILKKKKSLLFQGHGTTYQPSIKNKGIDDVGGSVSKMIGKEMFKVSNGVKASENDGFAIIDQRKISAQSVSVVKEMNDKGVGNKMMIDRVHQDNAVVENSKSKVETEKASFRRKVINLGIESSKNEDTKRMKLADTNGIHSRRTSMKDGGMPVKQWMDKAVENRADVNEEVLGNNYGAWKNDDGEEKGGVGHGKELTYSHGGEWKGRNGEGGSVCHVENTADTTPGSVKAEKNDKCTPQPSVYYDRTKSKQAKETWKKMNERTEHNMTYDYLDAIGGSFNAPLVNMETNEGSSSKSNKKVKVKDTSQKSDSAGEITKPGGVCVAGKNSEVFWEEYLL